MLTPRALGAILLSLSVLGCTAEPPTPAPAPEPAVETAAKEPENVPPSVPDPAPEVPVEPAPAPEPPAPAESARVKRVKSEKMEHAKEAVREWLRGLGLPESKIDPHHVDLSSLRSSLRDGQLRGLGRNQAVESVRLDGCEITGDGLQAILLLPNLKTLSLRNCQALDTQSVAFLFDSHLEQVDLTGCRNIDPRLFGKVGKLSSVKVIGP